MKSFLGAALLGLVAKVAALGEPYFDDSFEYQTSSPFVTPFEANERAGLKTYYEVDSETGLATSYGIEFPTTTKLLSYGYPGIFSQEFPTGSSYMAALPFDVNAPDAGIPINHVGFFYNPWGHPGGINSATEWLESHYDIHFHFWSPYVVNQIACSEDPNAFECEFNEVNDALFTADTEALPDNFFCSNGVLLMGAHCVDVTNDAPFLTNPSNVIGSYKGQVNFLEPMITLNNIDTVGTLEGATECYDWPSLKCYHKAGLYPKQLCIHVVDADVVRVYFTELAWQDADCDFKTFKGPVNENVGTFAATNTVARKKNCVIHHEDTLDAGYSVIGEDDDEYCCRHQGFFKDFECLTGCDRIPLNSHYVWSGGRCYYNCHKSD